MTAADIRISPYESYLAKAPESAAEAGILTSNVLGPRRGQDAFAMVAAMVAHGHAAELEQLYCGSTALHKALADALEFRGDRGFAGRLGPPFRVESSAVHALRALAGLGLALVEDEPGEQRLRAALAWHQEACSSPATTTPWTPEALAGGDTRLRQRLELLWRVAAPEQSAAPALAVAMTLRCLAHPAVQPRTGMLLCGPVPTGNASALARSAGRPGGSRGQCLAGGPGGIWQRLRSRAARWRPHGITVLFDRGETGAKAVLEASVARGLPAGMVPDPERMSLFAADESFQAALGRAWLQAGREKIGGTVLWAMETADGPRRYAAGGSIGAAFAVVVDELRRFQSPLAGLRARRLVRGNAVIGRIDDSGYMQGVEGYDAKLAALGQGGRVIVPAADAEKAYQATVKAKREREDTIPVARWKDAARKARRARPAIIIRNSAALAAVAGVVVSIVLVARLGEADTAERAQSAAALSQRVAALAVANLSTHLDIAQLLAVEATRIDNDPQARAALFQAATASPDLQRFLQVGAQVTALAAAADGEVAVAGTSDGHLVRFDLLTGSRTEASAGTRPITAVSVSADGTTVAADNGTQAFSWAAAGRHPPVRLGVPGSASSVAVSPSGRLVAVLAADDSSQPDSSPVLAVWNVTSGTMVRAAVSSAGQLAFASEATLISDADDGSFQEYASSGLRLLSRQPAAGTPANGYAYGMSPDGSYSGYIKYGQITAWSNAGPGGGQQVPRSGTAPAASASYLTFSDDGTLAASIGSGTITVSPMTAASAPVHLTGTADTSAVAFLGGDDRLVSAAGSTLALWSLQQGAPAGGPTVIPVAATQVASAAVTLAVSPDGRYLAIADGNLEPGAANMSPDGQIQPVVSLYRLGSAVTRIGHWEQPGSPVWSGDQLLLVSVSASDGIRVARAGGPVVASWPYHSGPLFGELSATASYVSPSEILIPDGTGMISFDPQTKTSAFHPVQLADLPHFHFAYVAAISPDGSAALLMGDSTTQDTQSVIYVNLRAGSFRVMESGQIGSVLFAGDRLLVQDDRTIQEWDASGQHRLQTLPASGTYTYGLAVSPGGTMLAQVASNGVASVTDLATGQVLESFALPTSTSPANVPAGITTMTFSPHGQSLLTATPGDVLSRWDIGEAALVKIACSRTGQSLTPAIWARYVQGPPPASLACAGASTRPLPAQGGGTAATPAASPAVPSAAPGPSSITGGYLSRITAVSPDDAWAVGNISNRLGLIVHWNGQEWQQAPAPAGLRNVLGVAALSADDAWAVGTGSTDQAVILHWDGTAWATSLTLSSGDALDGIGAVSASDIWAVGSGAAGGLAMHWDGTSWQEAPMPAPANGGLTAVTVVSASDAWAVGGSASGTPEIAHWDGTSWQQFPEPALPGYSGLDDVASLSATDAWAVGGDGSNSVTEHWNGTTWRRVPSPPSAGSLSGVIVLGADDAWAVGQASVILHWNGNAWSQVSSSVRGMLNGIAALSPQDALAVGSAGSYPLILNWNGTRWAAAVYAPAGRRDHQ